MDKPRILMIYTGGTIGMVADPEDGRLRPFSFENLLEQIPELNQLDVAIQTKQLEIIMDSSDMKPQVWQELASLIASKYDDFDGFVVLHGTDTLAFTASALSFMLEGLKKPVILTGSQLPIGTIRTDGKENLITSIEIAGAKVGEAPLVQEVAVYFEYRLMRGNRVTKYSAEHFDAFHSPNYPNLAEAGTDIEYNYPYLRQAEAGGLRLKTDLNTNIAVLKLFPGISPETVNCILHSSADGIIMESFGAGNGPSDEWFLDALRDAVKGGKTILNISQCLAGAVLHGRYATSAPFEEAGVISGGDMSFEAGLTKLMHVMKHYSVYEYRNAITRPFCGERD